MASISKNRGNGKYKVMLTQQELNTLTIALALLNIQDMEKEMEEQGLTKEDVEYDHLTMFHPFAKVTKLYPEKRKEEGDDYD
jgi:hypothetical protein